MNLIKKIINKHKIIKTALFPFIKIRQSIIKKKTLRQKIIIENIGQILAEDPIIKVDEFNGIFNIDIKSDLFFRLIIEKNYEPELVKLCLKYMDRNKDVIDIGANIGFFTVLFAKNIKKGKVLSVEPTKKALERLKKNIRLNNVDEKVEIFEGVVSNSSGIVEIKTIKGKEEYSSLGNMNHPSISGEEWTIEKVKATKLDDLINEKSLNPGFIKMDVEGVEHLVFEGAKSVLLKNRPIILSELSDYLLKKNGSSAKEVIGLIKSLEYDVFDPIDHSIRPGSKKFGDIICFPKELKTKRILC